MKVSSLYDTLFLQEFISRHSKSPAWALPVSYHLATQPHLAGEREYLDALLRLAPQKVRRAWIAGLLASRDRAHIPVWFEIMLFGWLRDIGRASPVVPTSAQTPDFRLFLSGQMVAVEALSYLVPENERLAQRRFDQLVTLIHSIERPFLLDVRSAHLPAQLKPNHFIPAVTRWLDTAPADPYTYRHRSGTLIVFVAEPGPASIGHAVFMHTELFKTNGTPLKKPLRRKADKYSKIRRRRPFLIALFLESPEYSDYDVATALFGRTNVIIDPKARRVLRAEVDRTGILYWRNTILHTSVSGVLAFTRGHSEALRRRVLRASFLENPYARRPINHALLSCRRRFVVTNRAVSGIQMQWLPDEPE